MDVVLEPAGRLLERPVGAVRRRRVRQMNDGPPRWPGRASGSARAGANRTRLIGPPPLSSSRIRSARGRRHRLSGYDRSARHADRRRVLIAFVIIAGAVGAGALTRADRAVVAWMWPQPVVDMRALIGEGRFTEAGEGAARELAKRPLDPEANLIRGVVALYGSISEIAVATSGERTAESTDELLATAVVSLRRSLLDPRIAAAEPAAQYALGKAYYHRGYFYYDLAVRYLEGSLTLGYDGADTYEYLGLAYTELGDARGLEYFRQALTRRPSDLLHLKVATMLVDEGDVKEARDNLIQAIELTNDAGIEQRVRYELGAVYRTLGDLLQAQEQYRAIIAIDERSADAHFSLGELYAEWGDPISARAAWRRARDLGHPRAIDRLR